MQRALVFGATGQIGQAVVARLLAHGWQVLAVSRRPRAQHNGLTWLQGEYQSPLALPAHVDALISCGPLDGFGQWFAATPLQCAQVIAFGSTSVLVKHRSVDAAERDLAKRLNAGEQYVFGSAAKRGIAATLLRPTLVYGAGRDASLTRIAALARRTHGFALPRNATGLRQPVHVDDLAAATIACLNNPAASGQAFNLGGGEVLAYDAMIARVLASLPNAPRLWRVPPAIFAAALRLAHATGRLQSFNAAAMARLQEDLVFDISPARQALGYAPRVFNVQAEMFGAEG